MVGIFSRFTVGRSSHRRTQSAIDDKEVLAPNSDVLASSINTATTIASHGIEVATEFKPVEHPVEPLDNDLPIICPLPEPSMINDGRIWKERASIIRKVDLQSVKDESAGESDGYVSKPPRPNPSNRSILPSVSAPENDLVNLLDECNAMHLVTSKNG